MIDYFKKGLKNKEFEKMSLEDLGQKSQSLFIALIVCVAIIWICSYFGIAISGEAIGWKLLGKFFIILLIGGIVGLAMNLISIAMEFNRRKRL